MPFVLEETAIHDAPHLVDAVAERESSVLDGNGGRGSRQKLTVQICKQVTTRVWDRWKLIRRSDVRTGTLVETPIGNTELKC